LLSQNAQGIKDEPVPHLLHLLFFLLHLEAFKYVKVDYFAVVVFHLSLKQQLLDLQKLF